MRFAANLSLLFPDEVSFPERCARVAAQGFSTVEILFPYDMALSHYQQPLADHGLHTLLINTPIAPDHFGLAALPQAQSRFRADFDLALQAANTLGATAIHLMAGLTHGIEAQRWQATLLENLDYALNVVAGSPITLQLEALNRRDLPGYAYSEPAHVLPLLLQMNSPQLRLQFDFYHSLVEQLPLLPTLQQVRDVVTHVQIADPVGRHEPNLQRHPEVIAALQYLHHSHYHGSIGCEYKPATQFETGLDFLVPLQQAGLCTEPRISPCI